MSKLLTKSYFGSHILTVGGGYEWICHKQGNRWQIMGKQLKCPYEQQNKYAEQHWNIFWALTIVSLKEECSTVGHLYLIQAFTFKIHR